MYIHMYIAKHAQMCACIYIYMCMHIWRHIHECICVSMHVYIHLCLSTSIPIWCMHEDMYVCSMHKCAYVITDMYACMYVCRQVSGMHAYMNAYM